MRVSARHLKPANESHGAAPAVAHACDSRLLTHDAREGKAGAHAAHLLLLRQSLKGRYVNVWAYSTRL